MTTSERVLLAVAVVAIDLLMFVVPVVALLAAWVLVARPPWFRDAVERLYARSEH